MTTISTSEDNNAIEEAKLALEVLVARRRRVIADIAKGNDKEHHLAGVIQLQQAISAIHDALVDESDIGEDVLE